MYALQAWFLKMGIGLNGRGLELNRLGGSYGAQLMGAGTATTPASMSTASGKALSFYINSSATSGDNRGLYLRTYFTGVGGGGDSARIFASVTAAGATTVHGLHASVNFTTATTSKVTGQACAVRATLQIPNGKMPANGTYSALIVEAALDGASADPSGVTQLSLARFIVSGGDATARRKITKFLTIEDAYDNAAGMVLTAQNEPNWAGKTCLIRVLINGVAMNLIAVNPA